MSDEAKEILRVAAAAEQYSTHPIADAVVSAARAQGIDVPEAIDQSVVSGMGVLAKVDGKALKIGQLRFFEDLSEEFLGHVRAIQSRGMTVAILEYNQVSAVLGFRDAPRSESREVLEELRSLGFNSVSMLTGDNVETATVVAKELGIQDVRAGLLPDEKESAIGQLGGTRGGVIFVGDGINDAPSLARANVGVAMGGLGSDVALNAADVVLMQDNLRRLPDLIRLGRKTNQVIRGNLIFAAGIIALLTIGSVVFDALLPSQRNLILPFAVVGHEGSTVVVILNGLRLLAGPGKSRPQK